jgi:hypothetical protein
MKRAIKIETASFLTRRHRLQVLFTLSALAFCQGTHAVSPAPDGGYSGGNTAEGQNALFSLTTGVYNTAVGLYSLESNAAGNANTAIGAGALFATTADQNTATGAGALFSNSTGEANAAHGAFALFDNTDGSDNTASGAFALSHNTTGAFNTAIGLGALQLNTTNNLNTALGANAGINVTTASNVICIGSPGADVSDSCYIGNIYGNVQPVMGTDPDYVTINSGGRLGRGNVSSQRYKHDIQPMDKASEVLFALKPVSFRYNKEYDATQRIAFGLIAEDVAEVAPDLVGRNKQGEPDSVRYEQINAMLLNEFLKEHKKVQELEVTVAQQLDHFEATIAELQKEMAGVVARSNEQDAKIQKVSTEVELTKAASRTVANK